MKEKLSDEHVKKNLSKVKLYISKVKLLKENLTAAGWIIHPSLRNNGLHFVFVQVRKLVGDFIIRVPFSLCGELSSFSHLKQGNGVCPCKTYASSHNGVTKNMFINI